MSFPHVTSVVRYGNPLLLPRGLYPPISAPEGVPVVDPIFVEAPRLVRLPWERSRRYGYRSTPSLFVSGYTLSDLTMRFVDFDRQWRAQPPMWWYLGGEIRLEVTVSVYVEERARTRPDCLSMIMTHELEHVADELDIVRNWLPRRLPLELRSRFDVLHDSRFGPAMRGRGDGAGSDLEQAVERIWVRESGRRAADLHSRQPEDSQNITDCLNA